MMKLLQGNSLDRLKDIETESIDMCITSPPYYALRSYGDFNDIWPGMDIKGGCTHEWAEEDNDNIPKQLGERPEDVDPDLYVLPSPTERCTHCRAWKGQLGLETTVEEYVKHLCDIFDEVKRVLKPTGSCWVNLGDTYSKGLDTMDKCLCNVPSKFAIAMCDRGWLLRNEIIWHKPSVMPSSVKDRFTVDFEKMFFFTKSKDYYFKQQTEPYKEISINRMKWGYTSNKANIGVEGAKTQEGLFYDEEDVKNGRNMRCVWCIPTSNSRDNIHVAPFPTKLIEIPFKACMPEGGTVLDPFCGSGTVLDMAQQMGLDAIGIERVPKYVELIRKRVDFAQTRLF